MNPTSKLIGIVVVILIVLNIVLLIRLQSLVRPMTGKPDRERGMEPKEIIAHRLHLDSTQIIAYDELIREHRSQIREAQDSVRNYKEELYHTLVENEAHREDSMIQRINRIQQRIEYIHYRHFQKIKALLCRKDQLQDYETLTEDFAKLFAPNRPPRGPREEP